MVLIKVILIILCVYFIGKTIIRSVLSYLFGGAIKNMDSQVRQQQEEMLRQKKRKKDGEVTVNYTPKSDKKIEKDEGDYVSFEEIK